MLTSARAGTFNFLNVLKTAVETAGWDLEWHGTGPEAPDADPDGYALFHAKAPPHDRALSFRRAYHYPFWQIESHQQRWRFDVARSGFDPASISLGKAQTFTQRLRDRVLPGPEPLRGDTILVPLQGQIRRCRSFQTMSPLAMLETVARLDAPVAVTLHPNEIYSTEDHAALQAVIDRHPNLTLAPQTAAILRNCAWVAAENSAVAFDGFLLGKPAVLFAQIDFHHIALNVADLGVELALASASRHAPDFDRYLWWFLQEKAINATRPDAGARILAAMRRGGWPI